MSLSEILNDRINNIMAKPIPDKFLEDSSNYYALNGDKSVCVPDSKTDRADVR